MIIWITGQHNAGKTTLAKQLQLFFTNRGIRTLRLDGDEWRSMTANNDYSEQGRRYTIELAMRTALALDDANMIIICSFISPYRDMRSALKRFSDVLEVYLHNDRVTETPERKCPVYEPPLGDCLDIDNSRLSVDESLSLVLNHVPEYMPLTANLVKLGGGIWK